jgi:hypothetical protein
MIPAIIHKTTATSLFKVVKESEEKVALALIRLSMLNAPRTPIFSYARRWVDSYRSMVLDLSSFRGMCVEDFG